MVSECVMEDKGLDRDDKTGKLWIYSSIIGASLSVRHAVSNKNTGL